MLTLLDGQSRARADCLEDRRRAGAYRLLLRGQVDALAVLFGAGGTDHTRADDLRLALGTAADA